MITQLFRSTTSMRVSVTSATQRWTNDERHDCGAEAAGFGWSVGPVGNEGGAGED